MKNNETAVTPSIDCKFTFEPLGEFAKILGSPADPPDFYQARLDLAHLSLCYRDLLRCG